MKSFVIDYVGGDSIMVNVKDVRSAVKIAKDNGRNLMKYNNQSSLYFVWDEQEENILFTVHTFKLGRKTISKVEPCNI
ncbi:hypothetical protein BT401P3_00022 [Bacteroides phage BT401P3]|nr:hypothetical protein BT401P3_00022 [Bacteroides phage BT401P3]